MAEKTATKKSPKTLPHIAALRLFMPTEKIYNKSQGFLGRYEKTVGFVWKLSALLGVSILVSMDKGPIPDEKIWLVALFILFFEVAIIGSALTSISRFGVPNPLLKIPILGFFIDLVMPEYTPRQEVRQLNMLLFFHFVAVIFGIIFFVVMWP